MTVFRLNKELVFPPPHLADPTGLLAVGGDLAPLRLVLAYHLGIFPWYSKDEPILWWSPDPRFVLFPKDFKFRRNLKKTMRRDQFEIRYDSCFDQVVKHCSQAPRPGQDGTWITDEMMAAYISLNKMGHAHSLEVWRDNVLVGGLYGLAFGSWFFGESMFYLEPQASKVALAALVFHYGNGLVDCQVGNPFFEQMGAVHIPRSEFLAMLTDGLRQPNLWQAINRTPTSSSKLMPMTKVGECGKNARP